MYVGSVRNHIEYRRNHFLEYSPQAARARLVLESDFRDFLEYFGGYAQFNPFALEYFAKLIVNRVSRLGQDPDQHLLGQIPEARDDGQPAGKFGYQPERE